MQIEVYPDEGQEDRVTCLCLCVTGQGRRFECGPGALPYDFTSGHLPSASGRKASSAGMVARSL